MSDTETQQVAYAIKSEKGEAKTDTASWPLLLKVRKRRNNTAHPSSPVVS